MSGDNDLSEEAALLALAADANQDGVPDVNQFRDCPSCGEPDMKLFCANCGLKNDNCRRSSFKLLGEAIGSFFAWDGRMWRTLLWLFTKPGRVARDYADGARTKFSSPVRVYLVASFLFAALMAVTNTYFAVVTFNPAVTETVLDSGEVQSTYNLNMSGGVFRSMSNEELTRGVTASKETIRRALERDSEAAKEAFSTSAEEAREALSDPNVPPEILEVLDEPLLQAEQTPDSETDLTLNVTGAGQMDVVDVIYSINRHPAQFNDTINAWLPWITFAMAPLAALLGALFIRGRGNALIYDHMIHAVYLHAMVFMMLILSVLASKWISGTIVLTVFTTYFAWYVPKATKTMFGRGWFKTIWATVWVGWSYMWTIIWLLLFLTIYTVVDVTRQELLLEGRDIFADDAIEAVIDTPLETATEAGDDMQDIQEE